MNLNQAKQRLEEVENDREIISVVLSFLSDSPTDTEIHELVRTVKTKVETNTWQVHG